MTHARAVADAHAALHAHGPRAAAVAAERAAQAAAQNDLQAATRWQTIRRLVHALRDAPSDRQGGIAPLLPARHRR